MFDCAEARRWLRQAKYTLKAVKPDINGGFYSWACFKGHQAAEYALKALLRGAGLESFGHDLLILWSRAREICIGLNELHECIAFLNKMYIPPRYPDAWAGESIPYESYTRKDASESLRCTGEIIRVVEECIVEACENSA